MCGASRRKARTSTLPGVPMDQVIVLSGLPASGKSSLRRHLVEFFGVCGGSLNWEDNDPPPDPPSVELWQAYGELCSTGDPSGLALSARRLGDGLPVIEWGLPVNTDQNVRLCLGLARSMRASGEFRFAWLELTADRARARYQPVHPAWMHMFDPQAAGIERHHAEIMSAIDPQVIEVLASDGSDRPVGDLALELLGAVDLGQ